MKNKIGFALFTAFLAVVLIVTGCSNFDSPIAAKRGGEGNLRVIVKGFGGTPRTIQPVITYNAKLTPAEGAAIDIQLINGPNLLTVAAGTYGITVKAYNGDVLVAQGSATGVAVTATGTAEALITFTPEDTEATEGTFSWNLVNFGGSVVDIKIYGLDDLDDLDISALLPGDIAGTGNALVGSVDLDPGVYLVAFDVDGIIWNEILWIDAGLTSEYETDFANIGLGVAGNLLTLVLADIADGTYTIPAYEFIALEVAGVTTTNIVDVQSGIRVLVGTVPPADLAGLKVLVDAALVWAGAPLVDSSIQASADAEIADFVANGTTGVVVSWTGYSSPDYEVTITVGSYTFTVSIIPPEEPAFFEQLSLRQSYAVYKFNLPAGASFGDYKAIKVSYMMDTTEFAKGTNSSRLMGNYTADMFALDDDSGYMFYSFSATSSANAPFIYQNNGGDAGIPGTAVADAWFNITYPLVGNTPHGSFDEANRPAAGATGPFLFGVGLPGNWNSDPDNTKTQLLKNITMVHKTDPRKNIVTSEFFGFVGYGGDDGLNGDSRSVVANADYVEVIPEVIEELTLQQSYAVYRFTLPEGAKYGDYNAIKASYKMDTANWALGTNSTRLMGNYAASKFSYNAGKMFFAFSGATDDTNANGPYIYQNNTGDSGIPGDAEAGKWFTISYPLVGNTPHGQFLATSKPGDADTGPFLFGVGIPGNDSGDGSNAKTQLVKEITMVHKTDPRKNIVTDDFFGFVGQPGIAGLTYDTRKQIINPEYTDAPTTYFLDLTERTVDGEIAAGAFGATVSPVATVENADGSVTLSFTHQNTTAEVAADAEEETPLGLTEGEFVNGSNPQAIFFTIPAELKAKIITAGSAIVNIQGVQSNTAATFRYVIGDATLGSGWNQANIIGASAFPALGGPKKLTLGAVATTTDNTYNYIILQTRTNVDCTLVINSIKIILE